MTQKLLKFQKKLTDHKHDKYIITPEFNKLKLAPNRFNSKDRF